MIFNRWLLIAVLLTPATGLSGCAVIAVADAAVAVVATGVEITAKTAAAAVDFVLPDGAESDDKE